MARIKPATFDKNGTAVVTLTQHAEDEERGYVFYLSDELVKREIPDEGAPIDLESGDEITASGVYKIPKNFSGILAISGSALNVKLISDSDTTLDNVLIDARAAEGLTLTVENVNISTSKTNSLACASASAAATRPAAPSRSPVKLRSPPKTLTATTLQIRLTQAPIPCRSIGSS